jgi:TolB-like protein/class 3 adenylate cyclase/Tfp pilus assembly protein PilF
MEQQNRQLAAILFTDIVGYTAMMQRDEQNALAITRHYIAVLKQSAEAFHGRILNDYGDGSLCSFPSATEAVKAAVQIQQQLQQEPKVPLRIGIHVGELFFEETKVMGDSVNVASRIQSLGQANSILFSKEVFDKLKNQPEYKSVSLGKFEFKNVDEPLEIFALANEGLIVPRKEDISGKLKEIQKKSARSKWIIITTVLVLLIAAFFIYKNISGIREFTGDKSIAVLPFENIGTDSSEEYVSDGITQDIISKLSKISSLDKVIGWFSVRSFKKTTKTLKQIADELGVAAVLSGTMQKHEGKTRIIAELIEVSTNKRLWGFDLEYESKDIVSIQSNVAGEIVTYLKADVTPKERINLSKHQTENVDAYKFYLKGRAFWNTADLDSAKANYSRAIQLDPNYALGYAGLADCYDIGRSPLDNVPIAKFYAAKALSLDSTLSEALTTMGFIQQVFDYDWSNAKKNLRTAVDLDPNNYAAHMYYGLVLMHSTSDKEEALQEFKKAVDIDPLSYYTNWLLSRNYYFAGKYDLAIDQFKKMLLITAKAQRYVPTWSLGLIYLKKHDYSQAKDYFDQLPEGDATQLDNYQVMQSYAYAVMGEKAKAITLLEKTLKRYPNLDHYRNSQVYVALGNFDEAMNQLELGYTYRETHMFWIKVDPEFDPIRNDPRFKALLKKMNL